MDCVSRKVDDYIQRLKVSQRRHNSKTGAQKAVAEATPHTSLRLNRDTPVILERFAGPVKLSTSEARYPIYSTIRTAHKWVGQATNRLTECPIRRSPRWADEAIYSKGSMLCPTPGFAIFFSRRRAAPIFRSMTLLWRFASTMDSSSLRSAAAIWVSSAPAAPHRAFGI